jgi:amino acid permease
MFQDITNTIYDTLLIFQCYGLGICYLRIFKKLHSVSGRSLPVTVISNRKCHEKCVLFAPQWFFDF